MSEGKARQGSATDDKFSFADETAKATGKDKRSVHRDADNGTTTTEMNFGAINADQEKARPTKPALRDRRIACHLHSQALYVQGYLTSP